MKGMRNIAPFGLRMPDELREAIAVRAKRNGRSMNSEIVQILYDALLSDREMDSNGNERTLANRDEFFGKIENMDEFASALVNASKVYQDMLSKIVEEHIEKSNKKPT